MKMQEIRQMAKRRGINSFGKSKEKLIREIQLSEGSFDCFGTAEAYCDQDNCCFRSICLNGNTAKSARQKKKPTMTASSDYYNTKYFLAKYPS